jgi:hypothetical protein
MSAQSSELNSWNKCLNDLRPNKGAVDFVLRLIRFVLNGENCRDGLDDC